MYVDKREKMSLVIAGFTETQDIAKKVAKLLKVEYTLVEARKFPDGEWNVRFKKNPKGKSVVLIHSLSGEPNQRIIECVLAEGIARDYGAKKVILVATYLSYMRQDTHFLNYDSFSSKHIIELLSSFDKIIAIDPHLHRIHNMRQLSAKAESLSVNSTVADYIKNKYKKDFEIIGPDEESAQWSAKIAKLIKKKVFILHKDRLGDKKIKQTTVKLDKNKNYIFIDDIISTGRTLAGAIEMAKSQGAKKLVCIGIHGVLIDGADKLLKKNAELITTNTIPGKYAKIDVSPAIAQALKKYK